MWDYVIIHNIILDSIIVSIGCGFIFYRIKRVSIYSSEWLNAVNVWLSLIIYVCIDCHFFKPSSELRTYSIINTFSLVLKKCIKLLCLLTLQSTWLSDVIYKRTNISIVKYLWCKMCKVIWITVNYWNNYMYVSVRSPS